ncbi:uncharacterized protein LOC118435775 isoform X1 [Folsomia candida]|uniref:uncharacterized protein LOC118435775 isoform X1 n=1 Tax=Folsomia candida TaxID=158441 RepID=UPI001604B31D|nr:uncharacterized protein LOC118435775 isoform X1 [Folsomia candida]
MDSINLLCVSKILVVKIEEYFSYEYREPTDEEIVIGNLLLDKLCELVHDYVFVKDEEFTNDADEVLCSLEPYIDENGLKIVDDDVSMEYKKKAVEIFNNNKAWKFRTFRQQFKNVKHHNYIKRWRDQIDMGGTKFTIMREIENFVLERFREARTGFLPIHTIDIRRWALIKAKEYPGFNFKACDTWISTFKRRNRISSRKVQKLVKRSTVKEMDQILQQTENFRHHIQPLLNIYEKENIWNTDQTGFKYEILSNRTLTWKGERTTIGTAFSPKNKVTHSYTVQYIIAYNGSILPQVYVCLQEIGGTFGPVVQRSIFTAPNLVIASSKSGKLSNTLVADFLDRMVVPHAEYNQILYILDNWTGQTNMQLYDERFEDKETLDFNLKFVPEGCTDLCQPLDTYFHRQLKFIVKQFYYFDSLHCPHEQELSELCTRNGILKLQSLVHFLLSAPVFLPMIRYCWYSSGLWADGEKPNFKNVSEVCFQSKGTDCSVFDCNVVPFISCSWCKFSFCFNHFYINYHMSSCTKSPYN